jgi:serine/threonine-protein kinase
VERAAQADDGANAAAAQALFDDAKAAMARSDWATACPKLEESQRLQPGGGTLLFLGLCREGEGRTATAWAVFNETLSAARRDGRADREKVAKEHIASLAQKLTRLTIKVAGAALEGLEVRRDGELVPKALFGTAMPVDPGIHSLRATAPGMKPWQGSVDASAPGATATIEVPPLEREAQAVAPAVTPAAPQSAGSQPRATSAAAPAPRSPGSGGSQRTIALAIGGLGVVGLGVGTAFAVVAMNKKSASDKHCPGGSTGPCDPQGVSLSKDAVAAGNLATVGFGVGAAALVGAGVLWFTAPANSSGGGAALRVVPVIGEGSFGAAALGVF